MLNFLFPFSLPSIPPCSFHGTGRGHHQHPAHCQPSAGHPVGGAGLLLPGTGATSHLRASAGLGPEHQGAHLGPRRAGAAGGRQHGAGLRHQEDILKVLSVGFCMGWRTSLLQCWETSSAAPTRTAGIARFLKVSSTWTCRNSVTSVFFFFKKFSFLKIQTTVIPPSH